jgi:hypothetical protein
VPHLAPEQTKTKESKSGVAFSPGTNGTTRNGNETNEKQTGAIFSPETKTKWQHLSLLS